MKTLHTNYKLGAGDITITVVVGNGQRGNSLVALGDQVLANGPNVTAFPVRGALAGKTLTVITTASKTNPQAEDVPVTYSLVGGAVPGQYSLEDDFGDGESQLQFTATFDLVGQ